MRGDCHTPVLPEPPVRIVVRAARPTAWLDWLIEAAVYFPEVDLLTRLARAV